ncbi:hypothetical protein NUU61_009386 [Penicillium alfredii]|uniref:Cryptic loci regulator 2 N-terminal domain-containing protein n=1 Tax=Penicillium alfredii TaxID=1506179 RepID=A0A9W9EMX9_9EURO|nr:uncharacterized protein NUU61_009386 [Penicillium alfredii]KAJ5084807.1 hypothetical protein NUU61_009386 [Penicillium alfredii]
MSSNTETSEEDPNEVIIPIDHSLSDGDMNTWPTEAKYTMPDDSRWRMSLAEMWLKKTGAYEEGVTYIIESLPEGYGLFSRPRGTNPSIQDSFLHGHPSGIYFQSRVTFFPHFYHLMTNSIKDCPCVPCKRAAKRNFPTKRKKRTMETSQPQSPSPSYPCDEEGPDYWRILVMKLKKQGTVDEEVEQRMNMDWVLTHEWLGEFFERMKLQAAFIPRRGETVLWTYSLEGQLVWNDKTNAIEMLSDKGEWLGIPEWRAGVVTQVPEEETVVQDIVETSKKKHGVNYSGFRVEMLPDPLSDDKSFSLQSRYLPLKCIKPMNSWEIFLQTKRREDLHPSIENALTTMSSWSLLTKYRFEGTWPDASVFCKGIYIGSELLVIKDAVRLKPWGYKLAENEDDTSAKGLFHLVTDVMVIEEIRLVLTDCIDDPQDPQLANLYSPRISGKVYTIDQHRANSQPFSDDPIKLMTADEVTAAFQQVGMHGYGGWRQVAGGKSCTVSQTMVLGRCHEPDANEFLYGDRLLGHDLHSVLSGRRFSTQVDARIPEDKSWFWGDYRAETLGITTMNNIDCGPGAEQRADPERWQAILKIAQGTHTPGDVRRAKLPSSAGRPPTKPEFAQLGKTSKLVSSALGPPSDSESEDVSDTDKLGGNISELELSGHNLTESIHFRAGAEDDDDEYADEDGDDDEKGDENDDEKWR